MLNTVEEGLEDIRQGKVLIVVDDEDRENEGDFIVSGEKITPEIVNFMITHGRGLLCAPLPRSRCEELCLAPMAEENTSLLGTPFTMSVDLRGYGCTTGVSAFDRSSTIKALVAGNLNPSEFARPGPDYDCTTETTDYCHHRSQRCHLRCPAFTASEQYRRC